MRLLVRGFLLLWLVSMVQPASARPHPGVEYSKLEVAGVPIHLVSVDLNRADLVLRPVVAPTGQRQSFQTMTATHRPLAAVNGTFFDTRTGITVGNLVSEGRLLSEGMIGSNLILHKDGYVELVSSARNLGRYQDWSEVDFAVGAGPTLIADGQFIVNPGSEGFKDPSLFQPRPRTAVGITMDGTLRMVVVTQPVSLWELAKVMDGLHCVHALNLDGGSSTGLSVGGQTVVAPARNLTNMIGVFAAHQSPELARATSVARSRAHGHYQKGMQLMSRGKPRKARSQMRQAVAKEPDQATYWRAAAQAELAMGHRGQAISDLERSGQLFLEKGELGAVERVAEQILELDKENATALLLRCEAWVESGQEDQAEPFLRELLAKHPGHPRAAELLTRVKFRRRGFKKL